MEKIIALELTYFKFSVIKNNLTIVKAKINFEEKVSGKCLDDCVVIFQKFRRKILTSVVKKCTTIL